MEVPRRKSSHAVQNQEISQNKSIPTAAKKNIEPVSNINDTQCELYESQQQIEPSLFYQDLPNIILLNILYMYQGLLLSFFLNFTKNYLIQEKHITGSQIATLRSIGWAFSIKFLWAPLMDTYFVKSFGRRKTYLIPAQFLISVILFVSAFHYESWMESASVYPITCVGMMCLFLITIQDIAVDSWSVELLHEENVAYASFSQFFGQQIGSIIGYQLFIYLSDKSLMKRLFGLEKPLLTPFSMCITMSISILIGTLFVLFFRNENSDSNKRTLKEPSGESIPKKCLENQQEKAQESEERSFCTMLSNIKKFFSNPLILVFIIFLLSVQFGHHCVETPADIILLEKGFHRSTMATIELCLIPFTQLINVFAAKFAAQKKEFLIWKWCFVARTVWNIATYFVVNSYQKEDNNSIKFIALFAVISVGSSVVSIMPFISNSAFLLRICDLSIGGTYITFINSFSNLGNLWPSLLVSWMSQSVPFLYFLFLGTGCNIGIFLLWKNKVIELQESPPDQWKIKHE